MIFQATKSFMSVLVQPLIQTSSNSLVEELTAATATELYLNSSFYSHYAYLVSLSKLSKYF